MNNDSIRAALALKTMPVVVLVLGLGIAAAAGLWSNREFDNSVNAAMSRTAQRVSIDITQRVEHAGQGLAGVRGLFATRNRVMRKEFQEYVDSRDLPRAFPGVRGFGFIEQVIPDGMNAFVAAERADGEQQFNIRQMEDKSQAELYVIKFIEPAVANVGILGLDVGSEPLRRVALQRAIDTGEASMTEPIQLIQDKLKTAGVLLLMPVYKLGTKPSTVAERRAALRGLLYAPIVMSELLNATPDVVSQMVNFKVFQSNMGTVTKTRYYDTDQPHAKLDAVPLPDTVGLYSFSQALPLFGQVLTLRISSLPAFDANFDRTRPWVIFATLALLSALVAQLMRLQANGLQRSENRALQMTEKLRQEEARWRDFSIGASDWFWETNAEHFYTYTSANWVQFYGLPLPRVADRNLWTFLEIDTLNSPNLIKEQLLKLAAHLPVQHFECQIRVADGSLRWIVSSGMPKFDVDGRFCGYRGNGSDITERKHLEQTLLGQHQFLQGVVDNLPVGLLVLEQHRQIRLCNIGLARILGLPAEFFDRPNLCFDEIIRFNFENGDYPNQSFDEVLQRFIGMLEGGSPITFERMNKSGSWLEIHGMPLSDAGVLLTYADITARKNAEAATAVLVAKVNTLNQQLSLATDSAQIGVWDYTITEDKLEWSKWMFVLYGVREEDFSGAYQAWRAGLHPDDEARGDSEIAQALRGEKDFDTEFRVVWPNGEVRHIKANALVLRDDSGKPLRMIGANYDVTERVRVQVALTRQQRFIRTIADAVPIMIGYWDHDLRCRFANKTYETWFNVSMETIVGVDAKYLLGERLFEIYKPVMLLALGGETQMFQREANRMDGSVGYVSAKYIPDFSEGVVRGFFVVVEDITELKSAEKHLLSLNQELSFQNQEKAKRADDLSAARDGAESANLAKSDFLSNMSHEIRSPLNAILGLTYLLERSKIDQESRAMVNKIRDSGRMLLGIISDILDMSKIEAGQMEMEHAAFDLAAVIDHVAVSMGLAIGEKDIELMVSPLPKGVSHIVGDALRLQQVLVNLSSNAAKFTQSGHIELHIEVISGADGIELLRFCVQDTGIGIAPELQSSVFSAFSQADTSTTRRFGGTGLGLTICRQLVGLMGGEIGLNSVPGAGSEFWFTLPVQRADEAQYSSPAMVRVEALIAEDNSIALKAIGAVALNLGWQIHCVESGAAVVTHLLERRGAKLPNVVVLDWKMPGMDGLATARAIRNGVPLSECPIVIMATPSALPSLAAQPDAALVDAVLTKPVTASGLYNAVMQGWRHRANLTGSGPVHLESVNDGLAGVRVLVVDDSDINRDVAQRILEGEGAVVTLAADGQMAIDWLLAHPLAVDLVLMDVQMPVLDGMEATRRLRRMPQFDDLPIVALTAGAFKSQQQAALDAGMTHFVSKPFDVPLTIALIQRLRRASNLAPAYSGPQALLPVSLAAQKGAVASGVMDVAHGLKLWTDVPTYQSYLRRFVGGYGDVVELIRKGVLQGDSLGGVALAHKLAGVAANLALADTRMAALVVERVLGTQENPEQALFALALAVDAAVAEIHRYAPPVRESSGATPLPSTLERQAQLKANLLELLRALDSDNAGLVKKRLSVLSPLLPAQAGASILACVLDYDFRGAEAATRQLASDYLLDLGA